MAGRECRPGEIIGQRYRVESVLGRGVLGEAYACVDTADGGTRVVMKVLRSTGKRDVDSVGPEIARLTRLRNPRLARVMSFGTLPDGVSTFIVEEFVQGEDLLKSTDGLSVPAIVRILAEVCRALAHLHENGIAHGALKPSNAVVCGEQEQGGLKLLHYGLLQMPVAPGQLASSGTLAYVAPDLVYGRCPDPASDLYALGVLAYQLLTRRLPFEDEDHGYLMQKHLQGRVDTRPLERLEFGPALGQIIRALLERDPEKRPSSVQEVLRLLRVATGSDLGEGCCAPPVDSYFASAAFVGRSTEMSLLKERAARVQQTGRGWTVFITGESGSGKTRCMEEFRVWALLSGWRVLEAGCSPGEEKAYAPYRQLLSVMDRLYPASPAASDKVIFRFEEVPQAGPAGRFDSSGDSAAGPFRDSLTRELVRRLADRPTILLLHDFHWSDEATTAVLDYLTSDITSQSILICVSLRPGGESPAAIGRVVEQCCRQSRAEVIGLEPLGEGDVRELIAGLTGEPEIGTLLGGRLYQASGGNPFFVEEILKHLVDTELLRRQFGKWQADRDVLDRLEVPASVAVLVNERLGKLSGGAAELARWLAVFQRKVSAKLLRLAACHSVPALDGCMEELLSRQLVRMVDDTREQCLEFRHALVAEVLRREIPVRQRRGMHLKIAQALEEHFEGEKHIQELALHYTEGRGGEKALEYALRAADMYRFEFATQAALRLYDYVLRNPGSLGEVRLCEVAMQASDACCALGLAKQAVRIIKTRMSQQKCRNSALRAQLLACLAHAYRHAGDMESMTAATRAGLKIIRHCTSSNSTNRTKAILTTNLAFLALVQSRSEQGIKLVSQAIVLAESDASITGMLQSFLSALYRVQCRLREAIDASSRSITTLRSANALHYLPVAYSHLGAYLNAQGRFSRALKEHEAAVEISARTRSVFQQAQALSNLAECLCRSGEFPRALEVCSRMLRFAESTGNHDWFNICSGAAVETYLSLGRYDSAEQLLRPILHSRGSSLPVYIKAQSLFLAAWLNVELGDLDSAMQNLAAVQQYAVSRVPYYEAELGDILRARIYLMRGNVTAAKRLLVEVRKKVIRKRLPYQLCLCHIRLAELLLMMREEQHAGHYARGALRLARAMPARQLEAEAHILLGKVTFNRDAKQTGNAQPEKSVARLHLAEAVRIADQCQSLDLRYRAHYELALVEEKTGNSQAAYWHAKETLSALADLKTNISTSLQDLAMGLHGRRTAAFECKRITGSSDVGTEENVLLEEPQIRTLYRFSRMLVNVRSMDDVLEGILSHAMLALSGDCAFVALKPSATGPLAVAKSRGWREISVEPGVLLTESILLDVFSASKPFVTSDTSSDARLTQSSMLHLAGGQVLCGPLVVCGEAIGLLLVAASKATRYVSDSQFSMFGSICNLAAVAIDKAAMHRQLMIENCDLQKTAQQCDDLYPEIVGNCDGVKSLKARMAVAASSPLDVLIVGESGTGKELVARAIHRSGNRAAGPLIAVDCGSLSESLFEAELFGHRRGAFTGATESRAGLFEAANGGVLLLDEVSNLAWKLQGKLLRALQEREIRRVGESITRKVDVQVIAITNRDLFVEVSRNRFRDDLYYRLHGMKVQVPPLRERAADIPVLVQHFLSIHARLRGIEKAFSRDAMAALCRYQYPGNIRELKSYIEDSYYSCPSKLIGIDALPEVMIGSAGSNSLTKAASDVIEVIRSGKGSFESAVKRPFMARRFGTDLLREIVRSALEASDGRYRDAFRLLRIPSREYAATMQFLKRHSCYLDFRLFRRKSSRTATS